MINTLFTIGYEGSTVDEFIATLVAEGVQRAVDVRQLPQSRRPGFSKSSLGDALVRAGIAYEHQRQLGDPKSGRDAARAGNMDLFRTIFADHMTSSASQGALAQLAMTATGERCVLVCYERNPLHCHRNLLCDGLQALGSFRIRHLGVPSMARSERSARNGTDRHVGAC